MNPIRRLFPIAILTMFALLTDAVTVKSESFSLYSASNMIPTNAVVSGNETAINPILPVIEMTNIPLSQGIRRLLHQSRMRFTIEHGLDDWWTMTDAEGHRIHEPILNFRWTNMTATDALYRLLAEHHLMVKEEPVTEVSRITYGHDFSAAKDLGFFRGGTNARPVIQFTNIPITAALDKLAHDGSLNYMLDPELRYGETDWNGQIIRTPTVTLRYTNVTPEHVFIAICTSRHLVIARDPRTGVILVRYRGHDVKFVTSDFYRNDARIIPVIEFTDAPISDVLKDLVRQARMKCIISPRVDTGHSENEPRVNLRWQNITAPQAFAAVCESYDLDVIKYPVSGFIRVEPND
ncbi:MAG TPA: hypothetical protein VGJ73_20435 [Verrucomicrobiae bacterium]